MNTYDNNIFDQFDNGITCIYCDETVYPYSTFMTLAYNTPILNDPYGLPRRDIKFDEYESMIPSHKKIEFEIERKERKMSSFAKKTYYTSINFYYWQYSDIKYCCGKFKHTYNGLSLNYNAIRAMHVEENNKLIEEYAHSLESEESIKQKLEDCYKKYCTISNRLTNLIDLIYGIIDEDMSSLEKIAGILGIDKISHSDMDLFHKKLQDGILCNIYITERILISRETDICKWHHIDFIKNFTKNLMIIYKIVNSADINIHNANEIKKSNIMNEIYDKLKECYNKIMAKN